MNGQWLRIQLVVQDEAVSAGIVDAAGGQRTPMAPLEGFGLSELVGLGRGLGRLARSGRPAPPPVQATARRLFEALFSGERGRLFDELRGRGQGELMVEILADHPALRGVPWSVMRGPSPTDDGLGLHPSITLVRSVHSSQPALPREISGAVRVLSVAPTGMEHVIEDQAESLEELIQAGELDWLPPSVGEAAKWEHLFARLHVAPRPHILHITCHGRVREGQPELQLDPEADAWLPVSILATALAATQSEQLRLVILEACSGSEPGALATAAELLASRGVESVLAHLWPVDAGVARNLSRGFLEALTGAASGDVAAALHRARLGIAGTGSLHHLSATMTLRGDDPKLFDFSRRRVRARRAAQSGGDGGGPQLTPVQARLLDEMGRRLEGPCSVILAHGIDPSGTELGHKLLRAELGLLLDDATSDTLPTLMQRFELSEEREELRAVVQEVLGELQGRERTAVGRYVDGLAQLGGPGLYLTLLWLPLIERALARRHPDKDMIVLQPLKPDRLDRLRVFVRKAGSGTWERMRALPERLNLREQIVIVRLFGGFPPEGRAIVGDPVLTEDDQMANLEGLNNLPDQVLAWLAQNPVCMLGLSPLSWSHRSLLRRIGETRSVAPGSIASLRPEAGAEERRYWESETGPGGMSRTVSVVDHADMAAVLVGAGKD